MDALIQLQQRLLPQRIAHIRQYAAHVALSVPSRGVPKPLLNLVLRLACLRQISGTRMS